MEKRFINRSFRPLWVLICLSAVVIVSCAGNDSPAESSPPTLKTYLWSQRVPAPSQNFNSVAVASIGELAYILTSGGGPDLIRTENGGRGWRFRATDFAFSQQFSIRSLNGRFFAVGDGRIFYSSDGLDWIGATWSAIDTSAGCLCLLRDVSYGSGRYVAVGLNYMGISLDGYNWVSLNTSAIVKGNTWFTRVIRAQNQFIAFGTNFDSSTTDLYTSTDGTSWDLKARIPETTLLDIAVSPTSWVAVGERGLVYYSSDGTLWEKQASGVLADLLAVTFGNNEFFAVGTVGTVLGSADGKKWVAARSPTQLTLRDIIWTGSRYIVAGQNEVLITSP